MKRLISLLLFISILFTFISCSSKDPDDSAESIYISDDGYWVIDGEKTDYKAIGEDGEDGVIPSISISADGYWIINHVKTEYKAIGLDGVDGINGVNGQNGTNGISPTIEISEDGYWVINGTKTSYRAVCDCGCKPSVPDVPSSWIYALLPSATEIENISVTSVFPENVMEIASVSDGTDEYLAVQTYSYGRNSEIVIGTLIDESGAIVNTKVIDSDETAGFGDKVFAEVEGTSGAYTGSTGESFEEYIVSGATLTSQAYANAIETALTVYNVLDYMDAPYFLSLVVDDGLGTVYRNRVGAIALALVTDADGTIVAARIDSAEAQFFLNADNTDIVTVDRFTTKVELGDSYSGMPAGSWADQAAAFETFLIGKTVDEVADCKIVEGGANTGLVSGCTLVSSTPIFQSLVAKAAAYEHKVPVNAVGPISLGLAIDAELSGSVEDGVKVTADFAAVVMEGDTVVAAMLDSAEARYDLEIMDEVTVTVTLNRYNGTKNEQGSAYDGGYMPSGSWYQQAQAFANTTVGKTVAELTNLSTEAITGCSIYTGGYKAVIVRAASYAR